MADWNSIQECEVLLADVQKNLEREGFWLKWLWAFVAAFWIQWALVGAYSLWMWVQIAILVGWFYCIGRYAVYAVRTHKTLKKVDAIQSGWRPTVDG